MVAERPAVERKGVDSINYKLAAGLLADGLACGGPEVHHHYYGPNGEVIEGSGDCGNSPLIGQHLWEINNCRSGLYFAENCAIGISLGEGYDYSDNAIIDGLEVIAPDNNPRFFNPDLRFDPAALGNNSFALLLGPTIMESIERPSDGVVSVVMAIVLERQLVLEGE